jgi:hypothetical protein
MKMNLRSRHFTMRSSARWIMMGAAFFAALIRSHPARAGWTNVTRDAGGGKWISI